MEREKELERLREEADAIRAALQEAPDDDEEEEEEEAEEEKDDGAGADLEDLDDLFASGGEVTFSSFQGKGPDGGDDDGDDIFASGGLDEEVPGEPGPDGEGGPPRPVGMGLFDGSMAPAQIAVTGLFDGLTPPVLAGVERGPAPASRPATAADDDMFAT